MGEYKADVTIIVLILENQILPKPSIHSLAFDYNLFAVCVDATFRDYSFWFVLNIR